MNAASKPRFHDAGRRLLHLSPSSGRIESAQLRELAAHLRPGDRLVLNDAATIPASLRATDRELELRLIGFGAQPDQFTALLFGAGDHRTPTEQRPLPPALARGERLQLGAALRAEVTAIDPENPRWVEVRLCATHGDVMSAIYAHGQPIQYAHVPDRLALWDVQNRYAARPWAFEAPSAGFALDGEQLFALEQRGVRLLTLTHAAGISSTGSAELDRRLPLPERYEIPERSARELETAQRENARVIAVGTSVVRALEAAAREPHGLRAGRGEARLLLGPGFVPRVVDGVLSGMHPAGTSHFALLQAFAPRALLERGLRFAEAAGYLEHEFGDFCLIAD